MYALSPSLDFKLWEIRAIKPPGSVFGLFSLNISQKKNMYKIYIYWNWSSLPVISSQDDSTRCEQPYSFPWSLSLKYQGMLDVLLPSDRPIVTLSSLFPTVLWYRCHHSRTKSFDLFWSSLCYVKHAHNDSVWPRFFYFQWSLKNKK